MKDRKNSAAAASAASSPPSTEKDKVCTPCASAKCIVQSCYRKLTHESLFWASYILLGSTILLTQFVALPVLIQMSVYTFPVIYIGSHLSLQQKEVDPETGEKQMKTESMTRHDAMLFPFIGSACLLLLYLAYKFFPADWVNFLLTTYLSVFGCFAVGESLHSIVRKITPESWDAHSFSLKCEPSSGSLEKWIGVIDLKLSRRLLLSYFGGFAIVFLWLLTKHWSFHNLFAIGFCLQGIRIVSLGNFKISVILLCGLFVYDIFWVFGTNVMVTVAKAFDAPAKIIFPISYNPWKQSILGLGDIVLPGIFMAMVLRFDHHLASQGKEPAPPGAATGGIHQEFSKVYFWYNIIAYECGLVLTGLVMLFTKHPQPALLYLVPACLAGLFVPAWYYGQLGEVLHYSEEVVEPEKKEGEKEDDKAAAPDAAEKEPNLTEKKDQ